MTPGVPHAARLRAYLAAAIVTLGLCGVASRAWSLQVDEGDHYRALADRQHATRLDIPAPRGDVLDVHGRPLAVSADVDSVWANPRDIHDVTATAAKLAKLLGDDPGLLEAKLGGDHKFVWLARHVTPEVAKAVAAAKLPGVEVAREPRRWYPTRALTGPVIGRSDTDGNGVDGLELAMNELLAGRRGAETALRDARGHTMLAEGIAPAQPGETVQLSLDRSIQAIADQALSAQMTAEKAKNGVALVLDVETSRVLAMSSYPTYDPNTGESHGARNLPVTDAFEAGSVMKVFSVATALDAGAVSRPDTEFEIGNAFTVNPRVKAIRDVEFDAVPDRQRHHQAQLQRRRREDRAAARTRQAVRRAQAVRVRCAHRRRAAGRAGRPVARRQQVARDRARDDRVRLRRDRDAAAARGRVRVDRARRRVHRAAHRRSGRRRRRHRAVREQAGVASRGVGEDRERDDGDARRGVRQGIPARTAAPRTGRSTSPGFVCAGKTGTAHKYDPATNQYSARRATCRRSQGSRRRRIRGSRSS